MTPPPQIIMDPDGLWRAYCGCRGPAVTGGHTSASAALQHSDHACDPGNVTWLHSQHTGEADEHDDPALTRSLVDVWAFFAKTTHELVKLSRRVRQLEAAYSPPDNTRTAA